MAAKKITKTSVSKKASQKSTKSVQKSSGQKDIIELILGDHKPLKRFIKVMKDSEKYDISERKAAFEEFVPALIAHAKPEEQTWYVYMKEEDELDMREAGFEGDVEHGLADQMIADVKHADDEDLWSARVKVLAELVDHHIQEEEEKMLPEFKRQTDKETRLQLGAVYLKAQANVEPNGDEVNPSKKPMTESRLQA